MLLPTAHSDSLNRGSSIIFAMLTSLTQSGSAEPHCPSGRFNCPLGQSSDQSRRWVDLVIGHRRRSRRSPPRPQPDLVGASVRITSTSRAFYSQVPQSPPGLAMMRRLRELLRRMIVFDEIDELREGDSPEIAGTDSPTSPPKIIRCRSDHSRRFCRSCLQPKYLPVVWTETRPSRNWIWSSSPLASRHRRAQVPTEVMRGQVF
jgi:hypothetical protein